MNSSVYQKPILIDKTTVVKLFSYSKDFGSSKVIDGKFIKIPEGRSIKYVTNYSSQYTGGGDDALIDLVRGTKNWRLGGWQGFHGTNFEVILKFSKKQFVKKVSVGFLSDVNSWICFPTNVEFEISDDGKEFKPAGTIMYEVDLKKNSRVEISDVAQNINQDVKYIRIKAKNYGRLPAWHEGAGELSWLFVDEIVIE
jgi:hypothetical protein